MFSKKSALCDDITSDWLYSNKQGVPMAQISVRFYAQLLKRVSLRLEQAGSGVRNVEDSY